MFLKKLYLHSVLLFILGITFLAQARAVVSQPTWPPRDPVLLDSVKNIGFASQDYVGIYHFQVLTSGVVQKIDNKEQVKAVTVLAPEVITHLMETIETIPSDLQIDKPQRDGCMDAPSTMIYANQNDGERILIRARQNCIDLKSNNETANNIAEWLIKLERDHQEQGLNSSLIRIPQNVFSPANNLLGQEGYGYPRDPYPTSSQKNFVCREKESIPDDGFILYMDRIVGATNEFQMTIEKSLLTGATTETHKVVKQVQGRTEKVIKYVSAYNYVSLQIHQRTSHNLNQPFTAKFERKGDDNIIEARDLVCQYHID